MLSITCCFEHEHALGLVFRYQNQVKQRLEDVQRPLHEGLLGIQQPRKACVVHALSFS